MKALITGAPGWLGDRFVEILVNGFEGEGAPNDWKISCLTLPGMKLDSITKWKDKRDIECVTGDVTDPESLKKAMEGVDVVFHMVGIIHPKRISDLYAINTQGTENMLAASAAAGVKRFVHISSNSVAGTNRSSSELFTEEDPPNPYFNYGISKYKAEEAVRRYQKEGKLETVILRPCWYYGPNQPPRQSTFFTMIKKGNPIMFGPGKNLRSMTYLDNLCQAMLLAATKDEAVGKTYWIADEKPYATIEIYQTIADLLKVENFKPRFLPNFSSEVFRFGDWILQSLGLYIKEVHVAGEMNKDIACSVERAKKEIGYEPKIALREGMKRSIEWCRQNGTAF